MRVKPTSCQASGGGRESTAGSSDVPDSAGGEEPECLLPPWRHSRAGVGPRLRVGQWGHTQPPRPPSPPPPPVYALRRCTRHHPRVSSTRVCESGVGAGTVLFQLLCLLPGQPPGPHLRGGTPRRGLQLDVRCYRYKWSSVPLLCDPEAALLLPPKSEVTVMLRLKTPLPPPQMLVENYQENWNQVLGLYRTHLDVHGVQNMSFK